MHRDAKMTKGELFWISFVNARYHFYSSKLPFVLQEYELWKLQYQNSLDIVLQLHSVCRGNCAKLRGQTWKAVLLCCWQQVYGLWEAVVQSFTCVLQAPSWELSTLELQVANFLGDSHLVISTIWNFLQGSQILFFYSIRGFGSLFSSQYYISFHSENLAWHHFSWLKLTNKMLNKVK